MNSIINPPLRMRRAGYSSHCVSQSVCQSPSLRYPGDAYNPNRSLDITLYENNNQNVLPQMIGEKIVIFSRTLR